MASFLDVTFRFCDGQESFGVRAGGNLAEARVALEKAIFLIEERMAITLPQRGSPFAEEIIGTEEEFQKA